MISFENLLKRKNDDFNESVKKKVNNKCYITNDCNIHNNFIKKS